MKLTTLSFIVFTALSIPATAQTGDDIIKKHIDAIGGEKAWGKINSVKFIGNMNMQGMEIPASRTNVVNKGIRMDFSLMGTESYVIMTPTGGWQYIPMQGMDKPQAMPEDQAKKAMSMMDIRTLAITDKSLIAKADYAGVDTLDKVACHKVNITCKNGTKQLSYFDAGTYYLIRTDVKIMVKEGEEQEVTTTFGNYQKQPEGIVLAMSESAQMGGEFVYKSVEINKPVPDSIFKPGEALKLEGEKEPTPAKTKQ